jgi:hypothetical protein
LPPGKKPPIRWWFSVGKYGKIHGKLNDGNWGVPHFQMNPNDHWDGTVNDINQRTRSLVVSPDDNLLSLNESNCWDDCWDYDDGVPTNKYKNKDLITADHDHVGKHDTFTSAHLSRVIVSVWSSWVCPRVGIVAVMRPNGQVKTSANITKSISKHWVR